MGLLDKLFGKKEGNKQQAYKPPERKDEADMSLTEDRKKNI